MPTTKAARSRSRSPTTAWLDFAGIRNKARERGLASEAELERMSDAQVAKFVFHPGFSTAKAVTSLSGRGVGMDVVKTNIELIGGTVDIASEPGRGTTFLIKIPLTLAIVAALIVSAQDQRFAIPQVAVLGSCASSLARTMRSSASTARRSCAARAAPADHTDLADAGARGRRGRGPR